MAPPRIAPTPRPSKTALKLGVFDEAASPPPERSGSRALILAVVALTLAAVIAIVVLR